MNKEDQILLSIPKNLKSLVAQSKKQEFLFNTAKSGIFIVDSKKFSFVIKDLPTVVESNVSKDNHHFFTSGKIKKVIYIGKDLINNKDGIFKKTKDIKTLYNKKFNDERLTKEESKTILNVLESLKKIEKKIIL